MKKQVPEIPPYSLTNLLNRIAISDWFTVSFLGLLSFTLYDGSDVKSDFLLYLALTSSLFVFFQSFGKMYNIENVLNRLHSFVIITATASLSVVFASAFSRYCGYQPYSETWQLLWAASTIIILTGWRLFYHRFFNKLFDRGYYRERLIISATQEDALLAMEHIQYSNPLATIVGYISPEKPVKENPNLPYLGNIQDIYNLMKEHHVDYVVTVTPSQSALSPLNINYISCE